MSLLIEKITQVTTECDHKLKIKRIDILREELKIIDFTQNQTETLRFTNQQAREFLAQHFERCLHDGELYTSAFSFIGAKAQMNHILATVSQTVNTNFLNMWCGIVENEFESLTENFFILDSKTHERFLLSCIREKDIDNLHKLTVSGRPGKFSFKRHISSEYHRFDIALMDIHLQYEPESPITQDIYNLSKEPNGMRMLHFLADIVPMVGADSMDKFSWQHLEESYMEDLTNEASYKRLRKSMNYYFNDIIGLKEVTLLKWIERNKELSNEKIYSAVSKIGLNLGKEVRQRVLDRIHKFGIDCTDQFLAEKDRTFILVIERLDEALRPSETRARLEQELTSKPDTTKAKKI